MKERRRASIRSPSPRGSSAGRPPPHGRSAGRRLACARLALGVAGLAGAAASAQTWTFTPSIGIQETLTNNVNLTPSATAKSDFVSQLTPQLMIDETSPRTSLHGFIAASALLYARTGTENNQVYPSVGLFGKIEGIERFFFIDGAVSVSQQFFNPFGAQPQSLANATENRYTNASFRVSPYIQGVTPGNYKYELRNDNIWTNLSGAPFSTDNAYYDKWNGTVASPVVPLGWEVNYKWENTKFTNQPSTLQQLVRFKGLYQYDPQVRLSASGGYEDNHYPLTDYTGPIYGVGIEWNPTPRTSLIANWEHRFFGSSYLVSFDHRTPLTAITVRASRDTSSYPQSFLTVPATGNVPLLLDFLLRSRLPDPAQRLQFVNQLIQDQGLPGTLASPVNLYAQQNYLQENISATYGILGARNTVFLNAFYLKTQLISGAGNPLPPVFDPSGNNNTQVGASAIWTHRLSSLLTMDTSVVATRTKANPPFPSVTRQGAVTVALTANVSRNTTLSAGARYQLLRSDVTPEYTEAAVYAGLTCTFK